jgi:prevent-host-death family protein
VETIPQKQLRNHVGEVLRRVESGEHFIVTVAGRPVAELQPTSGRRWLSGPALSAIWHSPAPRGLMEELDELEAGLKDPFDR